MCNFYYPYLNRYLHSDWLNITNAFYNIKLLIFKLRILRAIIINCLILLTQNPQSSILMNTTSYVKDLESVTSLSELDKDEGKSFTSPARIPTYPPVESRIPHPLAPPQMLLTKDGPPDTKPKEDCLPVPPKHHF